MKKDAMSALKLTSTTIESITERLQKLVSMNSEVPALAYAGEANTNFEFACRGCDGECKGSCAGGCTSW